MKERLRILIVEDSEINRGILKNMLEKEWDIFEAENGKKALEALEEHTIDVILLDLIMPVMDGYEFLKTVKKLPGFCKIPVIVSTKEKDADIEMKALELGAVEFIPKTFKPEIVKKRIQNVVRELVFERKSIEQQLQLTQERLDSLINSVPGGIAILKFAEHVECTFCNEGLCELTGYSRQEILGKKSENDRLIHPKDRKKLMKEMQKFKSDKEKIEITFRLLCRDGSYRWLSFYGMKFHEEDQAAVVHAVFTDMTREKKAEIELKRRAERDYLTGIYNRETFYSITKEMLDKNPQADYMLVVWDVQNFKAINDVFGFKTGDMVLKTLGKYLETVMNGHGTYARLESDHFAICITRKHFYEKIEEMLDNIPRHMETLPVNYQIITHIGVYEIEDKTMSIGLMCDRAHLAIDTISKNYVQRIAFYNERLRRNFLDEQEMENRMVQAMESGEFFVEYQPIYDAGLGVPIGAEALARWRHPQKGIISPGIFIPVFERNGYITKLDRFVWEEVCRQMQKQMREHKSCVPVSVNVSRMNLYDKDLCSYLKRLLKKYELDISMLHLEITESAYMENPHQLLESMENFKQAGFVVLMDDFGSGYSSLNMLKDVPVDILKLDMHFIRELEDSERAGKILVNIVRMAKQLSMRVVAEGVENEMQYRFLSRIGCDYIQGFYFSRPLDQAHYEKILERSLRGTGKEHTKAAPRILVVDDSELSRKMIKEALRGQYDIIEACDGLEACEILENAKESTDLIITDIIMPRLDGMKLIEKITANQYYSSIPIVVITSVDEEESEINALNLGAVDVIQKPFNATAVRHRIKNILNLSEMERLKKELARIHEMEEEHDK